MLGAPSDPRSVLSRRYKIEDLPMRLTRIVDRTIPAGILALIIVPPIAFGAVHPRAYITIEVSIFAISIVWVLRQAVAVRPKVQTSAEPDRDSGSWGSVLLPLSLFTALILFQLVPLPPRILRILSPATYRLYTVALPGWSSWRTLSISPFLTESAFLKLSAYGLLLTVILSSAPAVQAPDQYGYAKSARQPASSVIKFYSRAVTTVLVSGLAVSLIGIVERLTWDGKVLWFFVPYDWSTAQPGLLPRASGPFVNPDHFCNYLAMVLPIAAAGTLFPAALFAGSSAKAYQLFSGTVLFVLVIGILLSFSRGGWCGAVVGTSVLGILTPNPFRKLVERRGWLVLLSAFILVLLLGLIFVNSTDRTRLDLRLKETVVRDATLAPTTSLGERFRTWSDSLGMVSEFPLLGVGLGGWPDIFARYRRPPWTGAGFWREAHDDYLQVLCETGFVGLALLAWLGWATARLLYRGYYRIDRRHLPILAALIAALSATIVHEFFDFSLQIPSNALLFVILLGIALRLSLGAGAAAHETGQDPSLPWKTIATSKTVLWVPCTLALARLIFLSLHQDLVPYPQDLKAQKTVAEARRQVSAHPALPSVHLALIQSIAVQAAGHGSDPSLAAEQPLEPLKSVISPSKWVWNSVLPQVEALIYLEPTNPYARDLRAGIFFLGDRRGDGLADLRRSAFLSPTLNTHGYYTVGAIPRLAKDQRDAIEEGLRQAVGMNFDGSVDALADFYRGLARFDAAADLYRTAARRESDSRIKTDYLLDAGSAYIRAGDLAMAERVFRGAAAESRSDPRPYESLVNHILAPRKDLDSIKTIIADGIRNGADPLTMDLVLAEGAQKSGDMKLAEATLLNAVAIQPGSFEANRNLGALYLNRGNFDRSASYFRRAAELDPGSGEAFYLLGLAEENGYQFAAAEKDYATAMRLSPKDASFRSRYDRLHRILIDNAPSHS